MPTTDTIDPALEFRARTLVAVKMDLVRLASDVRDLSARVAPLQDRNIRRAFARLQRVQDVLGTIYAELEREFVDAGRLLEKTGNPPF